MQIVTTSAASAQSPSSQSSLAEDASAAAMAAITGRPYTPSPVKKPAGGNLPGAKESSHQTAPQGCAVIEHTGELGALANFSAHEQHPGNQVRHTFDCSLLSTCAAAEMLTHCATALYTSLTRTVTLHNTHN